jgi:hypothetical protein
MRLVPALLLLAACAPSAPSGLTYRSTLDATTKGVALHDGGLTGHAGMYGTNCPFETVQGQVTGDYQLPGDGETIEDEGPSPLGPNTVLITLDDTVWFLDKTTGTYVVDNYSVPGLVADRLTSTGTVVVRTSPTGCAIDWNGDDFLTESTFELPTCPADVSFDVEPYSGAVVLANLAQVELLAPGAEPLVVPIGGDLAVWDESLAQAYVATSGGTAVQMVAEDGTLGWSMDIGMPITAIGAAGSEGGLAIAVADGQAGAIVLIDAEGNELGVIDTPTAAIDIDASPEGAVLAAVRPDHVYFFDVDRSAF